MRVLILTLALLPALAGCFTIASTITVRPDGSGTIRDRVEVSGVGALALTEQAESSKEGLISKALLQRRAAALGDGVTLVGIEEQEAGYTALYSFSDVRTLQYSAPDLPLSEDEDAKTVADDGFDLSFDFENGAPATLFITVPEDSDGRPDADVEQEMTPAERAQAEQGLEILRSLLGQARMSIEVVLDGSVVETDASFVDGSTVTILDLSFNELFDVMEEHPEWLDTESPPTDQLQTLLAGREGIAFQEAGLVTVQFE